MSQKLTKNSKNLVGKLKEKIKALEIDKDYWKTEWRIEKTEKDKKEEVIKSFKELRNIAVGGRTDALEKEISDLQEIIKWLIKPSTTGAKKLKEFPPFHRE